MIDIIMEFGGDTILVKVNGNTVELGNTNQGNKLATIEGLQLNKQGVLKEFPDLKDDLDWKPKAIQRFKDKIRSFNTEEERANYVIEDLRKHGYRPKAKQKAGFRVEKIR